MYKYQVGKFSPFVKFTFTAMSVPECDRTEFIMQKVNPINMHETQKI